MPVASSANDLLQNASALEPVVWEEEVI